MAIEEPLYEDLQPFRIEVRPNREHVYVIPVGELDMSTTAPLEEEVRGLAARGFREIVVDLRQVSFMDSTGLRLMLDLTNELGGDRFALIEGPQAVRRLIDLTGMRPLLRFVTA